MPWCRYEGPNQTRRRPIYLECRDDAVMLQPEGIALSESDFEGPMGPGNPLATALRAAREYMLAQHDSIRRQASRIRCCWSGRRASPPTTPPGPP